MSRAETKVYRQELLPTHFLERAGEAYGDHIAVVDGEVEYTWRDFRTRARRFASALKAQGVEKGDRIAFLALNSEPLLLAHFGVPLAGGTLVSINTRLSPDEIGYIIEQSGSTRVFVSPELRDQLPDTPGVPLLDTRDGLEDLLSQGGDEVVPTNGFHEDETITINLHVWDHGPTEGCHVSSSRRVSERSCDGARPASYGGQRVSLDPAHVPLQWVDVRLGGRRRGREERLHSADRSGGCVETVR